MRSLPRCLASGLVGLAFLGASAAPAAAAAPPVTVYLTMPSWPLVAQTTQRLTMTWSEGGWVRSRQLIQYVAPRSSGNCASGVTWTVRSITTARSPYATSGLPAGYCYRWTIKLTGWYGSTAARTTQPVLVIPTQAYTDLVWDGRSPNVQQAWNYTCVAASVQSELAIALGSFDTSSSKQMAIYQWGRDHLGYALPSTVPGLDPHSWAAALSYFSGGAVTYSDQSFKDSATALKTMASNMRRTGAAAGVAIKGGIHAWTIIGFTATADPGATSGFSVTGVYVMAPYQARTDPPPGTYYNSADFVALWGRYDEPAGTTAWDGMYVIVTGG